MPFILVGVGMVGWAGVEILERRSFLAGAVRSQGLVVGFVPSDSADEPLSCAIVEFEAGGARRRFHDGACYSMSPFSEGQHVVVVYDPARPERAEIASSWLSVAWVALGAGGLGFVVMGALGVVAPLWIARRIRHYPPQGRGTTWPGEPDRLP